MFNTLLCLNLAEKENPSCLLFKTIFRCS